MAVSGQRNEASSGDSSAMWANCPGSDIVWNSTRSRHNDTR